jgi:hypothetical protein
VPDAAFMIRFLGPAALAGVCGAVRYRVEFDAAV